MSNYYCTGKKVLKTKNEKEMTLVSLVKEEDYGKMAESMPVVAVNNSKVDLEFGKLYDCKVYFNKDKFNNLYKAEAVVTNK